MLKLRGLYYINSTISNILLLTTATNIAQQTYCKMKHKPRHIGPHSRSHTGIRRQLLTKQYIVSRNNVPLYFDYNFCVSCSIFRTSVPVKTRIDILQKKYKIFNFAWTMFTHYLVKVKLTQNNRPFPAVCAVKPVACNVAESCPVFLSFFLFFCSKKIISATSSRKSTLPQIYEQFLFESKHLILTCHMK